MTEPADPNPPLVEIPKPDVLPKPDWMAKVIEDAPPAEPLLAVAGTDVLAVDPPRRYSPGVQEKLRISAALGRPERAMDIVPPDGPALGFSMRGDAIQCACGRVADYATDKVVRPRPDSMRVRYHCPSCGDWFIVTIDYQKGKRA
jgi:hypothetical protein